MQLRSDPAAALSVHAGHRDLNNFGPHDVLRGSVVTLRVGIALTDMDTPDSGVTMLCELGLSTLGLCVSRCHSLV